MYLSIDLDCGCWVNLVKNKKCGYFKWIYSKSNCAAGSSNDDSGGRYNSFGSTDPFVDSINTCGWRTTSMKKN